MTLQSAIDAELPLLRAEAKARMQSRVMVHRSGGTTTDPDGFEVPGWTVVHYNLPFRLVEGDSHRVTVGGVLFEQATARGDMPADTTDLADGDLIEVTEGECSGAVYRIVEAVKGDQRTARRVPIAEAERPEEWP